MPFSPTLYIVHTGTYRWLVKSGPCAGLFNC